MKLFDFAFILYQYYRAQSNFRMVLSILTILLHNWINDSDMKSILLLATHDCAQCTICSILGSKAFCTKTIVVFPTAPVNDTSLIMNTK